MDDGSAALFCPEGYKAIVLRMQNSLAPLASVHLEWPFAYESGVQRVNYCLLEISVPRDYTMLSALHGRLLLPAEQLPGLKASATAMPFF